MTPCLLLYVQPSVCVWTECLARVSASLHPPVCMQLCFSMDFCLPPKWIVNSSCKFSNSVMSRACVSTVRYDLKFCSGINIIMCRRRCCHIKMNVSRVQVLVWGALSRDKKSPHKESVMSVSSAWEINGILKHLFAPSATVIWHAGLELKPQASVNYH